MNQEFAEVYKTATPEEQEQLDYRAAILEFDAGYVRDNAELLAAIEFQEGK
jgi:hypothetical protein